MSLAEDAVEQAIVDAINADPQRFNLGDRPLDQGESITDLGWDEDTRMSLMLAVGRSVDEVHGLTINANADRASQSLQAMSMVPGDARFVAESLCSSFSKPS